ncbi:1236_t:CDS:2 [Ambispora gerdemannii]|uniref:1236_t:CDS:1 n=1 Tax=Ambispora gerdemannii TaxID=144530 RepID=A0A9N9C1I8_9GLOM|nr:1236_t:CDS:2 [Ambispora gerdemannii]
MTSACTFSPILLHLHLLLSQELLQLQIVLDINSTLCNLSTSQMNNLHNRILSNLQSNWYCSPILPITLQEKEE